MARASVRSNLFTENLATISLHLRWQGGKQQTTLGTKYGFRSKLNFISYQRSKSREPNLSQRSKNKATTVTEWPLCRQDTSMKSIYSPFPIFSILAKLEMAKNIHLQLWKIGLYRTSHPVQKSGSSEVFQNPDWPLCRQDTSMKSIYSPFPIFFYFSKTWNGKKYPFSMCRQDDSMKSIYTPFPIFFF